MKTTIDFYDFQNAFNRFDRNDQFSRDGLRLIFDFLEESDPDMELDVIAICCEYNEAEWQTIAQDYNIDLSECMDDLDRQVAVSDYLYENTTVLGETDNGLFVYVAF